MVPLALLLSAFAEQPEPVALSDSCVKDGSALASCFGFNSTDATDTLHAAFASGASLLTIDSVHGQPYLVRPLRLTNVTNIHIVLPPHVTIMAKEDEFHGADDTLLRIVDCTNVTISGGEGATLQMRRDDYAVPSRGTCPECSPYTKAEWRHAIWLDSSARGVSLRGLRVAESGGDGLYIGGAHDVEVLDCVFDQHYRQGMSVISARGLRVERTVFSNTNGTAPMAGIDVEPDFPDQQVTGMLLLDVALHNNQGGGLLMNLGAFNWSTEPVDIDVSNITVTGTAGIGIGIGNVVGVAGSITVRDSNVEDTQGCGFALYRKSPTAAYVRLLNTNFSSTAQGSTGKGHGCAPQGPCAPLFVTGAWDPPSTGDVGGLVVHGFLEDAFDRPFLEASDAGYALRDITIDVVITDAAVAPSNYPADEGNATYERECRAHLTPNRTGVRVTAACK